MAKSAAKHVAPAKKSAPAKKAAPTAPAAPKPPAGNESRPEGQELRLALETALGHVFGAVDAMTAAVAANDEDAANAAGAALLAAATAAKAASTDIDLKIEQIIDDRLRAADAEADRQLEEKRQALAAALGDLDASHSTHTLRAEADQGGSGNAAAPAAGHIRVRVTGPQRGRFRAGLQFTPEPRDVDVTEAQLAAIQADPALSHELVAG